MKFPEANTDRGFQHFAGMVPHNKIMVVIPKRERQEDEIDLTDSLIYAGSHNLSMSAWGKWKKGPNDAKKNSSLATMFGFGGGKDKPNEDVAENNLSNSEIEMKTFETTHKTLNAVNTELGVIFPPGRMNTKGKQDILNNLPWKIPKTDNDWITWTENMRVHARKELGKDPRPQDVAE